MTKRSRRDFLMLGFGAATGAALAPVLASASTSTARQGCRVPGHRVAASPASPRLAGFTVSPATYKLGSWADAATQVDGWLGMPLAATEQKIFNLEGVLPSRVGDSITQLAPAGCRFLVSVKPSRTLTTAEQHALAAYLTMLKTAGASFSVVLWPECNDLQSGFTAQEWAAYWRHYAPVVVSAGVPLAYGPGCYEKGAPLALDWFPSSPSPSELRMDYYLRAYTHGVTVDALVAKAAALGIPAGLGEWGCNRVCTAAQWDGYCSYLRGIAPSLALGGIYFGTLSLHHAGYSVVTGPQDWKIPGIKAVAAALAAG